MTEDNTKDADLLAELNGACPAATPQEEKELAAAAREAQTDPLVVSSTGKKETAIQKADAAAKKAAGSERLRGYAVTVEGLFSTASADTPGRKVKKPYTLVVNLPSMDRALSVIKNKLLDKMLTLKYPGYVTYLTHTIVDVKPLSANEPPSDNVAYMTEKQLINHIKSHKVPVDPANYEGDVKNLRAAVVDFILNPREFKIREERRVASVKEDKALEELNK